MSYKRKGGLRFVSLDRVSAFCRRSYYVGDVRKEAIKAGYENGILNGTIPKETERRAAAA